MKQRSLILLMLSVAALVFIISCGAESDKRKIENTMREYVESGLNEDETFNFVGLSNHRDTVFMGVNRPCVGVIYTIANSSSGEKTRHYANVIFSEDYGKAISVKELDFDPIDTVKDKVKGELKSKIREKLIN